MFPEAGPGNSQDSRKKQMTPALDPKQDNRENREQEQGKNMLKPGFEDISRFFEHFRPIWAPGERL